MALIKCPECGKEVSDKAKSCISCGYPLDNSVAKKKVVKKSVLIVLSVVVIIGLCIAGFYMFNITQNDEHIQSVVSNETQDASKKEVEDNKNSDVYTSNNVLTTNSTSKTSNTHEIDDGKPSEEEYTKFICDYYNKNLSPDLGYFTYSLEKHAYQYHLGTEFIDSYKYLSKGEADVSLRAFQGFKTVFETMKQKSLQWSNELEYSYWPKLVIEVWSPGNEEILLICSSGEVNYSAYFNFK